MTDFDPVASLCGGMLIGLAATLLLVLNGRVAGVSGIVGRLLQPNPAGKAVEASFIGGLLLGPVAYLTFFGAWPVVRIDTSVSVLVIAGFTVGLGSRLGSGCTSGHGVVGLARLSPRSWAAVTVFMTMAIVTVFIMERA